MSRIDEALKRAFGSRSGDHRRMALVGDAIEPRDGFRLEEYPREHSTLSDQEIRARSAAPVEPGPTPMPSEGRRAQIHATSVVKHGSNGSPVPVAQHRRLAATLHDAQLGRGLRTAMVTSAVAGKGKTMAAASLAVALTESFARRVLLIDADLHQPSVHEVLGMPNYRGLSEALRAEQPELPLIEISPLLSVMSAGGPDPNPRAGLTSDRMRALLEECAGQFDWVLLDAPPVGFLPDARLLAQLTQAAVFVIDAGSTPFPLVEKAIAALGREHIVGTILNGVGESAVPANR